LATFESLVVRHAKDIAESLELSRRLDQPGQAASHADKAAFAEEVLLGEFDRVRRGAMRSFVKASALAPPGTLVLQKFYEFEPESTPESAPAPSPDQLYADMIAAMLASCVEANGRVWIDPAEAAFIASALERTGKDLLAAGFPRFAGRAFWEAADIHARFKNSRAEHRGKYLHFDAHRRTYRWRHPMRWVWELSRALFGYGYKPARLAMLIAVVIAAFALWILSLPRNPGTTGGDALFVALQNFASPLGLSDAKSVSPRGEIPLELETSTSDVLRTALLVLLIRRWFRG
jgi:hypothetical protein